MNARKRNCLININRVLILALTLSGLLMDGLQLADLPCTFALILWLWLPLCTRLEAHLMNQLDGKNRGTHRHEISPSI